jgi:hypothetical protein
MTTQPQPIPASTLLDDLHPARFLKPSDLLDRWHVQQVTVTISRLTMEEVEPQPGKKETKPVLYFKTKTGTEFPRGYLLGAKIDVESLKSATGAATTGELIGKRITITVGEHKRQAVLRISPQPVHEGN